MSTLPYKISNHSSYIDVTLSIMWPPSYYSIVSSTLHSCEFYKISNHSFWCVQFSSHTWAFELQIQIYLPHNQQLILIAKVGLRCSCLPWINVCVLWDVMLVQHFCSFGHQSSSSVTFIDSGTFRSRVHFSWVDKFCMSCGLNWSFW
jgi:hypothetical protein